MLATALAAVALTATALAPPARFAAGDGTTNLPDQVLRKGCRAYTYSYALWPTTSDWQVEMFLRDPDRRRVASGVLDSDAEPRAGKSVFWLCRGTTRYGYFKISGRLTTYDGWQQSTTWITPSYTRLHRWRR